MSQYPSEAPVLEEALPAVLMRVVSELNEVADLVERIEPLIGELHPEAGQDDVAERMMVLQGIDLAVQKTRGLAEFISRVTADMPGGWVVDVTTALNLVKLTDMQKALSSGAGRPGHAQPLAKASGDFEAF